MFLLEFEIIQKKFFLCNLIIFSVCNIAPKYSPRKKGEGEGGGTQGPVDIWKQKFTFFY